MGDMDQDAKARRPLRPGKILVLLTVVMVLVFLFLHMSPFRERSVTYEYTVTILSDSSEPYAIVCSLPCDGDEVVCEDVLSSLVVAGNVSSSKVWTDHGWGLRVAGTGDATVEWYHHYVYVSSAQSMFDHYSSLSMLDLEYDPQTAFVLLEGATCDFSLKYRYYHEHDSPNLFGSIPQDECLSYRAEGSLAGGWNPLPMDFEHVWAS